MVNVPGGGTTAQLAKAIVMLVVNDSELTKGLNKAEQEFIKSTERMVKAGEKIRNASLGMFAAGTAMIAGFSKVAGDAIESANMVEVSFGELADQLHKWSDESSANIVNTTIEIERQAGVLFDMATGMGIARDEAFKLSTGMVDLAADVASFKNKNPDEIFEKLQAAMTGEYESLKRLGLAISDSIVKQEAMNLGLYDGKGLLDANARAQAVYSVALRGFANSIGDVERTQGDWMNQLRALKADATEAAEKLGKQLIPTLQKLVEVASNVVNWFKNLDDSTAKVIAQTLLWSTALAGLGVVLGQTLVMLGNLARAWMILKNFQAASMIAGWGKALSALASPGGALVLAAAAIIAIAAAWHKARDEYLAYQKELAAGVNDKGDNLILTSDDQGRVGLYTQEEAFVDEEKSWGVAAAKLIEKFGLGTAAGGALGLLLGGPMGALAGGALGAGGVNFVPDEKMPGWTVTGALGRQREQVEWENEQYRKMKEQEALFNAAVPTTIPSGMSEFPFMNFEPDSRTTNGRESLHGVH